MFKLNLTNNTHYSEVGQANDLRWKIMFREGDTLHDQSGWIKCKDFFNDVVAWFKAKKAFSIYSFNNQVKKNDEGVYFLLKNVNDEKSFMSNMEIVNKQLKADLGEEMLVGNQGGGQMVVLTPNIVWENTYYISMLSMCIRLCNYGYKYHKWEDLWEPKAPAQQIDHAFNTKALKNARTNGFKLKPEYAKFWYYAGKDLNSDKPITYVSAIHDNGVCSWSGAMV